MGPLGLEGLVLGDVFCGYGLGEVLGVGDIDFELEGPLLEGHEGDYDGGLGFVEESVRQGDGFSELEVEGGGAFGGGGELDGGQPVLFVLEALVVVAEMAEVYQEEANGEGVL